MIASKSDERIGHYDRYDCLRCKTVIDLSAKRRDEPSGT
jgi:hypothetical protein